MESERRIFHGRTIPAVSFLLSGAFLALSLLVLGAAASKGFLVDRMAIVDVSAVFADYTKTKDRKAVLDRKLQEVNESFQKLEKEYQDLNAELGILKEDSPQYLDKLLRKKELEVRVMQLKNSERKALREQETQFFREIRDEIVAEIENFAKAHQLQAVLERQLVLTSEDAGPGSRWPIVHYVIPELDITKDITARINAAYERSK